MMETSVRRNEAVWYLGSALAFAVLASLLWNYTLDDAFISFRYARNLIRGFGLVYNPGEPPVEGFSNFLWTLLMAGVMGLGLEPEISAKFLGVGCGFAILALSFPLSRRILGDTPWRRVPPLMLATCPAFAMHAISGLETAFYTLLVLAGFLLLSGKSPTIWQLVLGGIVFGLAALTRPEGMGHFMLAAFVMFLVAGWREPMAVRIRRLIVTILPGLALFGIFLIWRHAYYGDWLPNTFYAKTGGSEQAFQGWKYIRGFFIEYGGLLLPFIMILGLALHPARLLCAAGLFFCGGIAIVILEGGDWMALYRFLVPLLPFLFVLIAEGLRQLHELLIPRSRPLHFFAPALLGLIALLSLLTLRGEIEQAFGKLERYESAHRDWGRWLGQNTPPGDRIALTDIGQFGYFADVPILDLAGLTDRYIGKLSGDLHFKNIDPGYVYDRKPAFIVLVCQNYNDRWILRGFPTEITLAQDPRLVRDYDGPVRIPYEQDYSYWLFIRKDLTNKLPPFPANASRPGNWGLPL